jgi:hypothetical protein
MKVDGILFFQSWQRTNCCWLEDVDAAGRRQVAVGIPKAQQRNGKLMFLQVSPAATIFRPNHRHVCEVKYLLVLIQSFLHSPPPTAVVVVVVVVAVVVSMMRS